MSMIKKFYKLSIIILLLFSLFFIQQHYAIAEEKSFSEPNGFVNDYEGIFTEEEVENLEQKLSYFEKDTGVEIAVVTVSDFKGLTIEEYANELFSEWGIGKKEEDNGVLILLSKKQRQVRIEVGYGMEEYLPDAFVGNVIDKYMIPEFKKGDYFNGVVLGVAQVMNRIKDHNYEMPRKTSVHSTSGVDIFWEKDGVLLIILSFLTITFVIFGVAWDENGLQGAVIGFFNVLLFAGSFRNFFALITFIFIETLLGFLVSIFKFYVLKIKGSAKKLSRSTKKYYYTPSSHSSSWSSSGSFSSSSSSSGGFSFGGGSSGGGGASGSW